MDNPKIHLMEAKFELSDMNKEAYIVGMNV